MNKVFQYIFWIGYASVLYQSFISIGGSFNDREIGNLIRMDYFLHFIVFFSTAIYYYLGSLKGYVLFKNKPLFKFILAVMILAVVSEAIQLFVPSRSFNPADMISNIAGLGVGLVVMQLLKPRSKRI